MSFSAAKPPAGQITHLVDFPVQPHLQKHFRSSPKQITSLVAPSRPTKGAARDRHERGAGCDGREGSADERC